MKNIVKLLLVLTVLSVILLVIGFIFSDKIFELLTASAKEKGIDFTVNTVYEAFVIKMKIAFFFFLLLINLFLTFSIWGFLSKNKKFLLPLGLANVLYIAGIFLYILIANQMFFKPIVNVKTQINSTDYIHTLFLSFLIGAALELPVVIYMLYSLIKNKFFKKS